MSDATSIVLAGMWAALAAMMLIRDYFIDKRIRILHDRIDLIWHAIERREL
jgi:hypothetical protein